jgi:hypothetical protein
MEKKLMKVKLRGKAEDAIQGLSHHDGPVILKMTCALCTLCSKTYINPG